METNKNFNFILIKDKIYLNIEQGIIELFFNLLSRAKPFSFFERTTGSQIYNSLPIFIIRAIRVLQFTYEFYKTRKKHRIKQLIPSVSTKFYGHCLLELRQGGYKIFNLKAHEVTTVFPKCMPSSEVELMISTTKEATKCKIAPNLINWNVNEYYLIEDYINLKGPSYNFDNLDKFYSEIFPILENIMTTTNPKVLDLQKYTRNKVNYLESLIEKLQVNNSDSIYNISIIIEFLYYVRIRLQNYTSQEGILLVFSHGDFWEGNIFVKNNYACVIDWHTLDHRSCYFDFYYIMFMLASKNSHLNKVDQKGLIRLTQELEPSFELFYNTLKNNIFFDSIDTINTLNHSDIYRYLFYIELIILKLQDTKASRDDRQISEVTTWIKRFKLFEGNIKIL